MFGPIPPIDDFDGEEVTEELFPKEKKEEAIPVDHCPRCGKGYPWYLSWERPCRMCGFPGLMKKEEGD